MKEKGEKRAARRENLQKKFKKNQRTSGFFNFFLGINNFFYGFDLRRRRSKKKKEKWEQDGNSSPCGGES